MEVPKIKETLFIQLLLRELLCKRDVKEFKKELRKTEGIELNSKIFQEINRHIEKNLGRFKDGLLKWMEEAKLFKI